MISGVYWCQILFGGGSGIGISWSSLKVTRMKRTDKLLRKTIADRLSVSQFTTHNRQSTAIWGQKQKLKTDFHTINFPFNGNKTYRWQLCLFPIRYWSRQRMPQTHLFLLNFRWMLRSTQISKVLVIVTVLIS